jgi:hypothetical protein
METKKNEPEKVDAYMQKFTHPLKEVMEALRQIILKVDKQIGEEVKWNAPTFFYSGEMEPADPKLYKRYIAVSNVHPKDHIMLVLPHGADVDDGSGFLEGEYKDGRRLLKFHSMEDVKAKQKQLQEVIKALVKSMRH